MAGRDVAKNGNEGVGRGVKYLENGDIEEWADSGVGGRIEYKHVLQNDGTYIKKDMPVQH